MSIEFLINIISNLPKIKEREKRNTIKLGFCISELSVTKFLQFLNLSFKKVNIEFIEPEIHLRDLFNKDSEFMAKLRDPESQEKKYEGAEPILLEMVRKDYH